jgi:hypothetical protein
MKRQTFAVALVALLAACAAPAPQGQEATGQQAAQVVVRDYDSESITGSHLKRRGGVSAMEGQTLSRDALEDWQRQRTGAMPELGPMPRTGR